MKEKKYGSLKDATILFTVKAFKLFNSLHLFFIAFIVTFYRLNYPIFISCLNIKIVINSLTSLYLDTHTLL